MEASHDHVERGGGEPKRSREVRVQRGKSMREGRESEEGGQPLL